MAILLTNDDGIDAPGLAQLSEALAGLDDLHVSAPLENRSGVGMGITLTRGLKAKKYGRGPSGEERWSLDGTPADAAKFGLQHVLGGKSPRLVVSGINYGPNLGVNIRCSGTVGAAFEAVHNGVNALAVSVEFVPSPDWDGAKYYARKVAELMLSLPADGDPFVLNLNVPSRPRAEIPGLVIARHGSGGIRDILQVKEQGGDYHLSPEWIVTRTNADCDATAFAAGYAVLTPLRLEMTDDDRLRSLCRRWSDEISLFESPS